MSDLENTGASPEPALEPAAVIPSGGEATCDAVDTSLEESTTDGQARESADAASVSPDVAQDAVTDDAGAEVQTSVAAEGASAPVDTQEQYPIAECLDVLVGKTSAAEAEFVALREKTDALQKAVTGFYTQTTDSMHKELEKYRKGLIRKLEQELFGELIEIYDAVDKAVLSVADNPAKGVVLLEGIRDQIDAALFNRGVEKREAQVGEKFDARRHHVVRPDVPTGDAALDGAIAATAKPGFDDMDESFKDLRGGCLKLRPVHVRLYKFDLALAPQTSNSRTDACDPDPSAEIPDAAALPNDSESEITP